MRHTATLIAATAAMTALFAGGLQQGNWTGTVTPPSGNVAQVTYVVGDADGKTTISLALGGNSFDFRDIQVADDHITFSWTAGSTDLDCRLDLQGDKSYEGTCKDAGGGTGHLVMVPPE